MSLDQAEVLFCYANTATVVSQPFNILTGLVYLAGGLYLWQRSKWNALSLLLVLVIFLTGVLTMLTHTFHSEWLRIGTNLLCGVFLLGYVFALARDLLGMPVRMAGGVALTMVPFVFGVSALFEIIPFLGDSAIYGPAALALGGLAWVLGATNPNVARNMGYSAGFLAVAILMRAADTEYCGDWPIGTHFVWHLLTAGAMIKLVDGYIRYVVRRSSALAV